MFLYYSLHILTSFVDERALDLNEQGDVPLVLDVNGDVMVFVSNVLSWQSQTADVGLPLYDDDEKAAVDEPAAKHPQHTSLVDLEAALHRVPPPPPTIQHPAPTRVAFVQAPCAYSKPCSSHSCSSCTHSSSSGTCESF